MAMWGDQTCQRFEATAVGFETGFWFMVLFVKHYSDKLLGEFFVYSIN